MKDVTQENILFKT